MQPFASKTISGRAFRGISYIALAAAGAAFASEDWSGSDLTIHGTTSPEATYVKQMNSDSLSAANITLGTELGSASIVAVDSTISASVEFCLGKEASPGYANLAATVVLTNSTLSCSTLKLGHDVKRNANGPLSLEIGPGSVVTCDIAYRYCGRDPVVEFTGGRMVFQGDDWWQQGRKYKSLIKVEGHDWSGGWPNYGVIFRGVDNPIDIELNKYRELSLGYSGRTLTLTGNGGLVKRGSGTLIWTSTDTSLQADYTGDTVVRGGGIVIYNSSWGSAQNYQTPSASASRRPAACKSRLD